MKHILLTIAAATATLAAVAQEQSPMRIGFDSEARYFEESLPIGNGRLGALVYGGADANLIYLNDITFWTGSPVDQNVGTGRSQWIPRIREALFSENYRLADSLQLQVEGHNSAFYQPLATLHIYDWNEGRVGRYHRELDIDSALCRDRYERGGIVYEREYLASHPDHLIAIRLRASKPRAINCRLVLGAQVPCKVKASAAGQLTMTGHATGDERETVHFCAMLRVAETDGTATADAEGITLRGATEATV